MTVNNDDDDDHIFLITFIATVSVDVDSGD
jgi:hypothetical protein